jgi:hypothetical protein
MRTVLDGMEVFNLNNGKFVFEIEDCDSHIFLTKYEFAKFMYLLKCRMYNEEIDKRVTKTIILKEVYELDNINYQCKMKLNRDGDNIIINAHYSKETKEKGITSINNEDEPEVEIIITMDEADN